MKRRQTNPRQWLIVQGHFDEATLRRLTRRSGLLLLHRQENSARLRLIARTRALTILVERPATAVRVHNLPELRRALLGRVPLVLLSPMFPTASHPDWRPLPPMRAAAFARLADRRLVALGGMNAKRYAKVAPLGFAAWAGISAFRT